MKECWLPALVKKSNGTILKWIETVYDVKASKNFLHFDIAKKFESSQKKIKFFESFLSEANIVQHDFFPLIRYIIKENKVILEDNKEFFRDTKKRPITYASHLDSSIYSFYSYRIQEYYEKELEQNDISKSVLAYRVVENKEWKWKNNIDFAEDVFTEIVWLKDCLVIALDISKFFDTINHEKLKFNLQKVLWVNKLSDDWYRVFRSLTRFSFIYKKTLWKYNLIQRAWSHKKVVDIDRFNLIRKTKKKEWSKIIEENTKGKWIPQWTAISWILANIYMLDFDIWMKDIISSLWGKYYRYSDDLLVILPYKNFEKDLKRHEEVISNIQKNIQDKLLLEINPKKTEVSIFRNGTVIDKPTSFLWIETKESIQYLGFEFDWRRVLIRNKTLSNFYKKMINRIKRLSHLNGEKEDWGKLYKWEKISLWALNRKYLYNGIKSWWRYTKDDEANRWNIDEKSKTYYLWFISYGYTAFECFEPFCKKFNIKNGIKKQLSGHRKKYKHQLEKFGII